MAEGAIAIGLISLILNVFIIFKSIRIEKLVATLQVVAGQGQNITGQKNITSQGNISVRS